MRVWRAIQQGVLSLSHAVGPVQSGTVDCGVYIIAFAVLYLWNDTWESDLTPDVWHRTCLALLGEFVQVLPKIVRDELRSSGDDAVFIQAHETRNSGNSKTPNPPKSQEMEESKGY